MIMFYLIQNKNGIFRNAVSFRAKQFRQLTCRGPQLIKTEGCADAYQRMHSPKRFLPLPFQQCVAQLGKAAVIQKFSDKADTGQPCFHFREVAAQLLIPFRNDHSSSSFTCHEK